MDNTKVTEADVDYGLLKLHNLTNLSQSVEMIGGLHLDTMHMQCYLLNNVTLRLSRYLLKNEFCLMSASPDADYKDVLQDICLDVCKIMVAPKSSIGTVHEM